MRKEGQRDILLKLFETLQNLQGIHILAVGYISRFYLLPNGVDPREKSFSMADHLVDHPCSFCVDLAFFILVLESVVVGVAAHEVIVPSVNGSLHLAIIILKK